MKRLILLVVIFVFVFPILLLLLFSVFSYYRYPLMFPHKFTLEFWENTLLGNYLFYAGILNSIVVGILNGVSATTVGIMTARALVKYKFPGRGIIKVIFSLPLFIPSIALFMGVHLMMIKFHLINSCMGVVLGHMLISIPYTVSIFISFFQGIGPDMENVARTMGCSKIKLFSKILIPLLAPGIYLSFSISFLISFSEYFSTFLIGGGKVLTLSTMLYPYISNGDTGSSAVLGIIFILINALMFLFADYLSRKKIKITNYLFE